jgi:hypothetical protein
LERTVAELGERVAWMEGRVEEQTMRIDDVRSAIKSLEERMDRRFDSLDRKIDGQFKLFLGVVVAALGTVASLVLRH